MVDPRAHNGRSSSHLDFEALLYASGELDGIDAASFERRLGEDQAARDALCQAVQLCQTGGGHKPAGPNPAYRARVRQVLRPRQNLWRLLGCLRVPRGHPLIWGTLGAAAAVLLMLGLERPHFAAVPDGGPSSPVAELSQEGSVPDGLDDPPPALAIDMAAVWAELPNGDHLRTARDEELRRKVRADDLHRLVSPHERRSRLLANPTARN